MKFNIIEREIEGKIVKTIDARELHEALAVGRKFSTWLPAQLKRAKAIQDKDYIKLAPQNTKTIDGRKKEDYLFTLSLAMTIAVLSNTDVGFQVNCKLIEIERQNRITESEQNCNDPTNDEIWLLLDDLYSEAKTEGQEHVARSVDEHKNASDNLRKTKLWHAEQERNEIIQKKALELALVEHKSLLSLTSSNPITPEIRESILLIVHVKMQAMIKSMSRTVPLYEVGEFLLDGDVEGFENEMEKRLNAWVDRYC